MDKNVIGCSFVCFMNTLFILINQCYYNRIHNFKMKNVEYYGWSILTVVDYATPLFIVLSTKFKIEVKSL